MKNYIYEFLVKIIQTIILKKSFIIVCNKKRKYIQLLWEMKFS